MHAPLDGQRHVLSRILLVEDDEMIQLLVSQGVSAEKREVHEVSSLEEARTALADGTFDAVILDLFLPDGDGRLLLTEIREQPDRVMLPVVVLSGRGGREAQLECFRLGADEFFEKPFDPEVLGAAVQRQLERGRIADAAGDPAPADAANPTNASRTPEAASASAQRWKRTSAPRILMVEDDEMTSALVQHRLGREGMEVVHESTGSDALRILDEDGSSDDYDLILLDVKLPGAGGFEILQDLRARPGWKDLPVVMLTGMRREADIVRGFELGANDYILKPFSPVELLARIHRLLSME